MAKVAVVGAGPAGASAGYHLASSGHTVTLIDRRDFPRPKTCGDWIPQGAVHALAMSGLYPQQLERAAGEYAVVDSSLVASPNGDTSRVKHTLKAYCMPRLVFDDILYRRAVGAGCRFVRRHVRDLRPGHREFLEGFDYVIDARGVYAGEPNCVALRAYWTLPSEDIDGLLASTVQIFSDEAFRRGYGWIFPVASDGDRMRFNVGVGMWKENRSQKKVTDYYEKFHSDHPLAHRLFERAVEKTSPEGYHLAVAGRRRRVAGGGILRIGDAANLTDPLTGEGIGNAILSGFLVAESINMSTAPAEAEQNWQSLYQTTFERDFRVALLIRSLLVGTRFKNAAVWLLRTRPRFAERFHRSLTGVSRYSDLLAILPRA